MLWFTNLSSWVSFALLVGIANAIAVGATLLVRAWSRQYQVCNEYSRSTCRYATPSR